MFEYFPLNPWILVVFGGLLLDFFCPLGRFFGALLLHIGVVFGALFNAFSFFVWGSFYSFFGQLWCRFLTVKKSEHWSSSFINTGQYLLLLKKKKKKKKNKKKVDINMESI